MYGERGMHAGAERMAIWVEGRAWMYGVRTCMYGGMGMHTRWEGHTCTVGDACMYGRRDMHVR